MVRALPVQRHATRQMSSAHGPPDPWPYTPEYTKSAAQTRTTRTTAYIPGQHAQRDYTGGAQQTAKSSGAAATRNSQASASSTDGQCLHSWIAPLCIYAASRQQSWTRVAAAARPWSPAAPSRTPASYCDSGWRRFCRRDVPSWSCSIGFMSRADQRSLSRSFLPVLFVQALLRLRHCDHRSECAHSRLVEQSFHAQQLSARTGAAQGSARRHGTADATLSGSSISRRRNADGAPSIFMPLAAARPRPLLSRSPFHPSTLHLHFSRAPSSFVLGFFCRLAFDTTRNHLTSPVVPSILRRAACCERAS